VDNAFRVRGIECIGQGQRDVYRCGKIERSARESLLQRLALEQFHRQVWWIGADIEHRADVRMIEGGCGAGLPPEALDRLLVGRQLAGENLDGDGAVQARVSRAIHLTHATRAEWLENLVRTEPFTGREWHRRDYGPPWVERAPGHRSSTAPRFAHRFDPFVRVLRDPIKGTVPVAQVDRDSLPAGLNAFMVDLGCG
jgi:hypothetical protein